MRNGTLTVRAKHGSKCSYSKKRLQHRCEPQQDKRFFRINVCPCRALRLTGTSSEGLWVEPQVCLAVHLRLHLKQRHENGTYQCGPCGKCVTHS